MGTESWISVGYSLTALGIIFGGMSFTMLVQHHELQGYGKTSCLQAEIVYWRSMVGPRRAEADAYVAATGQKVRLRYPAYSPHLVISTQASFYGWRQTVMRPTFTCFVKNATGTLDGVIDRDLPGMNGWKFMAALAAIGLAVPLICLLFLLIAFCHWCYGKIKNISLPSCPRPSLPSCPSCPSCPRLSLPSCILSFFRKSPEKPAAEPAAGPGAEPDWDYTADAGGCPSYAEVCGIV